MNFKEIFLILMVLATINAEYKSYRNYKVYQNFPETVKEVDIFTKLKKNGWNFWCDKIAIGEDVRVMVAPEEQNEFEKNMADDGVKIKVVIKDVQQLIEEQLRRPANMNRQPSAYDWTYYQTLEEIEAWLDDIVARHPGVASVVTIGKTFEERVIKGVKIDFKNQENPTIGMIEGGIHAREWISPATVTWIIKEFLESNDPAVRLLAENIVWHIFPVVNPDGYAYTFTDNRMWRKNRNTANFVSCAQWNLDDDISNGIDLNRNFGFLWMSVGASQNPCAETFAGDVAFSEAEAMAIGNYVLGLKQEGNLVFYYAFHSYSQMVLVPYSHLGGENVLGAHNYGDMFEIAIKGADKLRDKHGTNYQVGTSTDILYAVSGSSFDWVHGVANVPIVYLFELRDVGANGFLLPPEQIIPNNEEIMAALVEMDQVSRTMGYYSYSSAKKLGLSGLLLAFALWLV